MTKEDKVTEIVRAAGGQIVGRTRLQKIAYLLTAAGLEDGFAFDYRHYGPFSEDLSTATRAAELFGLLKEEERVAGWGGSYSVYTVVGTAGAPVSGARGKLAGEAAKADAIELELAATAAFLAGEGHEAPWAETARRKPEKAVGGRLKRAQVLYKKLQSIATPKRLPAIA